MTVVFGVKVVQACSRRIGESGALLSAPQGDQAPDPLAKAVAASAQSPILHFVPLRCCSANGTATTGVLVEAAQRLWAVNNDFRGQIASHYLHKRLWLY